MKTSALFQEYIWLVNTIRRARRITFLFSPLGHPRFQAPPLTRSHSARCSSLIPSITLWDKDDFGET